MPQHIKDFCEDKAREGDGQYAVAFAILELADHHARVARSLDAMGMNNMVAGGPPGALEMIAMQMKSIADAFTQFAEHRED